MNVSRRARNQQIAGEGAATVVDFSTAAAEKRARLITPAVVKMANQYMALQIAAGISAGVSLSATAFGDAAFVIVFGALAVFSAIAVQHLRGKLVSLCPADLAAEIAGRKTKIAAAIVIPMGLLFMLIAGSSFFAGVLLMLGLAGLYAYEFFRAGRAAG